MTAAERNSYFELKTDTPYLALTGELWGEYYVNCEENWPRHDGTALHMHIYIYIYIYINTYTYICTYSYARCPHTKTCIQMGTAFTVWSTTGFLVVQKWYLSRPGRVINRGNHSPWTCLFAVINHSDQWSILTHWGRVMHICVRKLSIFGSDNGLSPGQRQAII